MNSIGQYLNNVKARFNLDLAISDRIAKELYTHLEDKSRELKEYGFSKEEADRIAIQSLGPPELIARQIYETHAQGSWQEALFSALPHILFAFLFASYHWQNIFSLAIILILTVGLAVYGWNQGKPLWVFPWLGYYLLPVIAAGILLIYLPQGWGWIAALSYIPLALFAMVHLVKQTARRDWLYASLMLAPMPVIFSWMLSLGTGNELLTNSIWMARLQTRVPWIVLSLVVLAGATIGFIRLRSRRYKILCLLIPPIAISVSVIWIGRGNVDLWGWLIFLLALFAFIAPAWVRTRNMNS